MQENIENVSCLVAAGAMLLLLFAAMPHVGTFVAARFGLVLVVVLMVVAVHIALVQ